MLVTLANIFFQHGHKVKVITLTQKGALAAQLHPGIQQVNMQRGFKYNPVIMYRLLKQLKGFNVVHVHSFYNLRYLWLAKMLFGFNRPIFYHEHFGFRAQQQPTAWQKYILPKTIFIATSANISAWAAHAVHVPPARVFTLQNIIVKEEVLPRPKKQTGVIKLVLVSNLRSEKNIEFGIRLLQQLNKTFTQYHLTIIGKLYQQHYYNNLLQVIQETGTLANITFIHDADNVQQLLQQFDMGLHTSPSESGPLAVIEYLAQSLPFVAYNTGEVIASIKNELSECIALTFDFTEWINKLQQLQATGKPALHQKLLLAFDRHFSSETYYAKCLDIYKSGLA